MKLFGLFEISRTKKTSSEINNQPKRNETKMSYGGSTAGYRSDGSKYIGGISGSRSSMTYDHWRLRQNSRNAYQDSLHAHGIVTRWADSISDTGLKLDSNPNFKLLGITPEFAEEWASNTEQRFHLWAKDKRSSRSNTMNFYQSHRLYQIDDKRDGENFIRLYYSKDKSLLNPLQFDFIDPNQIRGDAYTYTSSNCGSKDGINRDSQGREKSYEIWSSKWVNNNYQVKPQTVPRIGEKSGRVMMLHCFTPEFPGQQRGFPHLTHVLQEFQNITDFTLAQIKKAINQSNIVLFMKNNLQDPSNPTEDMKITHPTGRGYDVSAESDPTSSETADDDSFVNYTALPEVNNNVPGSTGFFNTRMGDEIKPFENTAPSDSFESFVDAFIKSICSSTGMPIEVLQMKFSSNYSASRAALLMFWRVAMIWREEMESDYLNPIYEMWLSEEIASGRIQAPGWSDPIMRKAWLNASWIGAPMPNIDPAKTAKADKEYLAMSATTIDRISRNLNGSDSKSNMMKNEKTFKSMPIPPWDKKSQGGF